jgi:phosphoenolpyruvate---glycerone phosphotransferase subunit DhaL
MLNTQDWINIFKKIADEVEASKDHLNELDGAIGDGDHGVGMSIGFRAIRETVEKYTGSESLEQLFKEVGRVFLSAVGGAIGPLIGTMFMDSSKIFAGKNAVGVAEFKQMMGAMENAVIRRGKAELGDKTILDALHPAVESVNEYEGESLSEVMKIAAKASEEGAKNTANLISKRGRSSRLGERTIGHQDAGATSMALILKTLSDSVQ